MQTRRQTTDMRSVFHAATALARLAALIAWVLISRGEPARAQSLGVPAHVRALVTGDPASADFLTAQIAATIARTLAPVLPPGSSVHARSILPAPQPLGRGFQTSFTVPLSIDPGSGGAPIDATTIVDVENVDVPGFAPVTLAFRDDPERIVADGVLSRTTVDLAHPTRVYYYHQNMGARRRFCVVLSVNDSISTRTHVLGAAAGPNVDVMGVGHAVTRTFLMRKPRDEGAIVDIAGGKPFLERDDTVDPGAGVVGSIDLRLIGGGPLTMTVLAIPVGANPAAYLFTPKLPVDGHARHGNFDLAGFARWVVAYTAGGPDAAYTYGNRQRTLANIDPTDAGRDYGDYGVLQRVTFDLANPSTAAVTLFLYEKPLGGVVRSSFLVNGILAEIGCVRAARRYAITTFQLPARTTTALDVLTMTDGGSNYPIEVGVSATPPELSTPPISAPDGCFPKPAATVK